MNNKNIILIITLLLIFLSGCAEKTISEVSPIKQKNTQPKVNLDPYEIAIYYPGPGPQPDDELIEAEAEKLLKDINVKIKLNCIADSEWQNKKRALLNSGDKADLVFTASWNEYFEEVSRNVLIPLEDLLDKYGNDIKDNLSQHQLKASTVKGSIYAIPINKELGAVYGLLFNKELVDKHNIDINKINSLIDLESVLKFIKEKEPGISPFLLDGYGSPLRIEYMNNFEAIGSDSSAGAITKTGNDFKVINQYEHQRMWEATKLIYKWKLAGYFNNYTPDKKLNSDELKRQNNYFCLMSPIKPGKDKEMQKEYGIEYIQHSWQSPYADTRESTGSMMAIPNSCENVERTMMFLNRLYMDKKLVNLLVNGIEGKHYIKTSDNTINFPKDVNSSNSGYFPMNNWKIGNQYLDYIWYGEDPDKWNKLREFSNQAIKSRIMGFTYYTEDVRKENKVIEVISKYYSLYYNGLLDPQNSYTQFLEELDKAGVKDVISTKQNQLDKWMKSNN